METKKQPTPKLDIFKVLGAANKKDTTFYEKLTPEEQKAFIPLITMRWMSCVDQAQQVVSTNHCVNPYIFNIHRHPMLLWQLLTIANTGIHQRASWIKAPGRISSSKPTSVQIIQQQYGYSTKRAIEALDLLTLEDVLEIGINQGTQPDVLTKIKKEWKTK